MHYFFRSNHPSLVRGSTLHGVFGAGGVAEGHPTWFVGDTFKGLSMGMRGDTFTCRGHPYKFIKLTKIKVLTS